MIHLFKEKSEYFIYMLYDYYTYCTQGLKLLDALLTRHLLAIYREGTSTKKSEKLLCVMIY